MVQAALPHCRYDAREAGHADCDIDYGRKKGRRVHLETPNAGDPRPGNPAAQLRKQIGEWVGRYHFEPHLSLQNRSALPLVGDDCACLDVPRRDPDRSCKNSSEAFIAKRSGQIKCNQRSVSLDNEFHAAVAPRFVTRRHMRVHYDTRARLNLRDQRARPECVPVEKRVVLVEIARGCGGWIERARARLQEQQGGPSLATTGSKTTRCVDQYKSTDKVKRN